MANRLPTNDVRNVWQSQTVENTSVSLEVIRKGIGKLERMVRRRNLIGGGACAIVMASLALYLFVFPNLIQRIGSALTILGAGYLAYQLVLIRKRPKGGGAQETEPAACVKFYRAELERQRDFHRGLWFWSRLVILAPGFLVFCIGFAVAHPELAPFIRVEAAVFVLLLIVAVPLNLGRARKYQREIDALDAAERQSR
jgi:FtsH-binding integral membrane protein